jgi:16S rRNA (guanine527-N7)-methyltransferase
MEARFRLGAGQTGQLARFGTILTQDDHAPTTVRTPDRVRDDHLADALVALELTPVRAAHRIADLGSGAGIPGIPLAIALPEAHVTLLEANGRKCAFLRSALDELALGNATVVHGRAETWAPGAAGLDLVTARALAPLDVVAELAAPLLRLGGTLIAWRGRRDPDDEAAGAWAAMTLGLSVEAPIRVQPYAGAQHRHLHVLTKVAATPTRFPRRDGMARKRPLGMSRPQNPRS